MEITVDSSFKTHQNPFKRNGFEGKIIYEYIQKNNGVCEVQYEKYRVISLPVIISSITRVLHRFKLLAVR